MIQEPLDGSHYLVMKQEITSKFIIIAEFQNIYNERCLFNTYLTPE